MDVSLPASGTLINLSEWRPAVCRKSDPSPATQHFSQALQVSSHILKNKKKNKQSKNQNREKIPTTFCIKNKAPSHVCVTSYRILSHEFTWPYVVAGAHKFQVGRRRLLLGLKSGYWPPQPNPLSPQAPFHKCWYFVRCPFDFSKCEKSTRKIWVKNLLNLIWMRPATAGTWWGLSASVTVFVSVSANVSAHHTSCRLRWEAWLIWILKLAACHRLRNSPTAIRRHSQFAIRNRLMKPRKIRF